MILIRGVWYFIFAAHASNSSSIGSSNGEWNACVTSSARVRIPSASSRLPIVHCFGATRQHHHRGSVDHADATSFSSPAISRCTRSGWLDRKHRSFFRSTVSISRARAHTSRRPSSMLNTPAITAATYSPRLWPSTTPGSMPQLRHISASAYSKANNAGCA